LGVELKIDPVGTADMYETGGMERNQRGLKNANVAVDANTSLEN
jgi:hypothetical protein